MYLLVDEIIIPPQDEMIFLSHVAEFIRLYKNVAGVKDVRYFTTTNEALPAKSTKTSYGTGAEELIIKKHPKCSYLLMIVFASQKDFQTYHDHSAQAKGIHDKIASYFSGKQLTIRAALHGEEIT